MALCGCAFLFFGFETGKRPIGAIDGQLVERAPLGGKALARAGE